MSETDIIDRLAGIKPGSPLAAVLARRTDIMAGSQAAHDAVLVPREPGGVSHALRAVLAERMAVHLADAPLTAHYRDMAHAAGSSEALLAIADPRQPLPSDPHLAAIVRHIDMVTVSPKDATAADIDRLRAADVSEPDIVRISELAAFVNYQARVIAGFRLLVGLQ